mmetsp:Transcript_43151/g.101392  ORF Transcript_43151/g.101392 Transcript_43151/m.101392 type:complete len:218 (-) Transcript_43151:2308-2961(-)
MHQHVELLRRSTLGCIHMANKLGECELDDITMSEYLSLGAGELLHNHVHHHGGQQRNSHQVAVGVLQEVVLDLPSHFAAEPRLCKSRQLLRPELLDLTHGEAPLFDLLLCELHPVVCVWPPPPSSQRVVGKAWVHLHRGRSGRDHHDVIFFGHALHELMDPALLLSLIQTIHDQDETRTVPGCFDDSCNALIEVHPDVQGEQLCGRHVGIVPCGQTP